MLHEHDAAVARMLDEVAIRSLVARYGDAVTRRDWDEVAQCFLADATTTLDLRRDVPLALTGGEAVATFIAQAVERFSFFAFTIVNCVVDLGTGNAPNDATGRTYICELRRDGESGAWSNAYGCYADEFHRRDEHWRFASRRYASLARVDYEGATAETFEIPGMA